MGRPDVVQGLGHLPGIAQPPSDLQGLAEVFQRPVVSADVVIVHPDVVEVQGGLRVLSQLPVDGQRLLIVGKNLFVLAEGRVQVAKILNCIPEEIIFTSGGSESNNAVLKGIAFNYLGLNKHIITSQIEHPSIINPALFLHKAGFEVTFISVDIHGIVNLEEIKMDRRLPPHCQCSGVIKDDVVFFGEPIPSDVLQKSQREASKCDLILICGTSAVVHPFASLPQMVGAGTIIIEINAQPTPLTGRISSYLIKGKTGEILPKIVEEVKKISK